MTVVPPAEFVTHKPLGERSGQRGVPIGRTSVSLFERLGSIVQKRR